MYWFYNNDVVFIYACVDMWLCVFVVNVYIWVWVLITNWKHLIYWVGKVKHSQYYFQSNRKKLTQKILKYKNSFSTKWFFFFDYLTIDTWKFKKYLYWCFLDMITFSKNFLPFFVIYRHLKSFTYFILFFFRFMYDTTFDSKSKSFKMFTMSFISSYGN